jgi:hypothetical protein
MRWAVLPRNSFAHRTAAAQADHDQLRLVFLRSVQHFSGGIVPTDRVQDQVFDAFAFRPFVDAVHLRIGGVPVVNEGVTLG